MLVKQISVFLENKSGRLAEVTELLAKNGINIRALSIADTSDFGILRLIVNKPEEAFKVLKAEKFAVSTTDVIGVAMSDDPGSLAEVLKVMKGTNINIEYLYAFVGKTERGALVVFKVENVEAAVQILQERGIELISEQDIYTL